MSHAASLRAMGRLTAAVALTFGSAFASAQSCQTIALHSPLVWQTYPKSIPDTLVHVPNVNFNVPVATRHRNTQTQGSTFGERTTPKTDFGEIAESVAYYLNPTLGRQLTDPFELVREYISYQLSLALAGGPVVLAGILDSPLSCWGGNLVVTLSTGKVLGGDTKLAELLAVVRAALLSDRTPAADISNLLLKLRGIDRPPFEKQKPPSTT